MKVDFAAWNFPAGIALIAQGLGIKLSMIFTVTSPQDERFYADPEYVVG